MKKAIDEHISWAFQVSNFERKPELEANLIKPIKKRKFNRLFEISRFAD